MIGTLKQGDEYGSSISSIRTSLKNANGLKAFDILEIEIPDGSGSIVSILMRTSITGNGALYGYGILDNTHKDRIYLFDEQETIFQRNQRTGIVRYNNLRTGGRLVVDDFIALRNDTSINTNSVKIYNTSKTPHYVSGNSFTISKNKAMNGFYKMKNYNGNNALVIPNDEFVSSIAYSIEAIRMNKWYTFFNSTNPSKSHQGGIPWSPAGLPNDLTSNTTF